MTIAESAIDYFTAELFHDYLALPHADWMALLNRTPTTDTVAQDIPDSLSRVGMNPGKDVPYPSLLIAAVEAAGNTSAKKTMNAFCYLQAWMKPTDAGAANVPQKTTLPEASKIQVAVENRLRDTPAFYAWLATLPDERRQGWQIISRLQVANVSPSRDKKTGTVDFTISITLTLALSRLAF